jgi:hypothetical protein
VKPGEDARQLAVLGQRPGQARDADQTVVATPPPAAIVRTNSAIPINTIRIENTRVED